MNHRLERKTRLSALGNGTNLLQQVSYASYRIHSMATASNLWVPAINNHGGFGRWAFLEITDPWDAKNTIRAMLRGEAIEGVGPLFK